MHNAPSVTYPVGRSSFLGGLLGVLWLAGAGVTALGGRIWGAGGWRWTLALAVLLLAALLALHFWRRMPKGALRWDGHAWQGPYAPVAPARLSVHLDLQRHLLVRLHHAPVMQRWLWLDAASDPSRWNDLRRAVYSRAMTEPRQDAANP